MIRMKTAGFVALTVLFAGLQPTHGQGGARSESLLREMLESTRIDPHWMADGNSFWYASRTRDSIVISKVDPVSATRTDFFDVARLRNAFEAIAVRPAPGSGVPFTRFSFVGEGERAVRFTVEGRDFVLQLENYAISEVERGSNGASGAPEPRVLRRGVHGRPDVREAPSPDGLWFAHLQDDDLWLRPAGPGELRRITSDGTPESHWGYTGVQARDWAWWSPDSRRLVVRKGDFSGVEQLPVVDYLAPIPTVEWIQSVHNVPSGQTLPREELYVVDAASSNALQLSPPEGDHPYSAVLKWSSDATEVFYVGVDREYKRLDLVAADAETGQTRIVVSEQAETFALTPLWLQLPVFYLFDDNERLIWASEQDGWRHLYLYRTDGTLLAQLSSGQFDVGRVIAVDESGGWVYFECAAGDTPYDVPMCRVDLDGQRFAVVTASSGNHRPIYFSPSKEFFLDTYSGVADPPVVESRRADGELVQTLAEVDGRLLGEQLSWNPPEPFVVKAADGETDIYGVIFKPADFDGSSEYPVLEYIYGGPFMSSVPNFFMPGLQQQVWADLGIVVIVVDGRGTPGRGKAFQDVAYGNIGEYELPDHVAALGQLAATREYLDAERVGIIGSSWGGYLATRALLTHPDVYHVGIAVSPASHPGGKATVYEPYMGLPENDSAAHARASNLPLAGNLRGKLLLIHGTNDVNAPLSETMRLVNALVEAGRPHDLVILPNQDHYIMHARGPQGDYAREVIRRYLIEHLKP